MSRQILGLPGQTPTTYFTTSSTGDITPVIYSSVASIPTGFIGTAQVGTQSYLGDGAAVRNAKGFYAQANIPLILLSSATAITATGAISGLTAMTTVPLGIVVRVYCFAQTGLTAGVYYAIFSSTTACQLYTDAAARHRSQRNSNGCGARRIRSRGNPGRCHCPGCIGANGSFRARLMISSVSTANNKAVVLILGATNLHAPGAWNGWAGLTLVPYLTNTGAQNSNLIMSGGYNYTGVGSSFPAFNRSAIDTSLDQTLSIQLQITVATDFLILESYLAEALYGA